MGESWVSYEISSSTRFVLSSRIYQFMSTIGRSYFLRDLSSLVLPMLLRGSVDQSVTIDWCTFLVLGTSIHPGIIHLIGSLGRKARDTSPDTAEASYWFTHIVYLVFGD